MRTINFIPQSKRRLLFNQRVSRLNSKVQNKERHKTRRATEIPGFLFITPESIIYVEGSHPTFRVQHLYDFCVVWTFEKYWNAIVEGYSDQLGNCIL